MEALKEFNNDNYLAQKRVGLKTWVAFSVIADELVAEGRLIKDEYGFYKVKPQVQRTALTSSKNLNKVGNWLSIIVREFEYIFAPHGT